ncbi:GNAT family N-acetyltransferase [Halobacillus fulvus]|nr:GNAT family N-acetyltransferase [Halobacillus fulvus]
MNEWLKIFHDELRVHAKAPGFRREEADHVVRHLSEYGEEGFVIASDLNEENARNVIKKQLHYFQELFEWKVYSYDQPAHLRELLEEEGFIPDEEEAVMVMEAGDFQYQFPAVKVVEMTTKEEVDRMIELWENIKNEDFSELGDRLWRDLQNHPEELFIYGIYDGETLVSAAWMYLEQDSSFASLWGGVTESDYRGKGYYTALVAARAGKAVEKGYRFVTVDALPTSRPILEKLGFKCLAYTYGMKSPR